MVKFNRTQVTSLQESEETHSGKQAKKKSLTLPRPNGKLRQLMS
jgi:hypothetical protein